MADETYFMELAYQLALKGKGRTSPNPPVGAVLVRNGKIIGKGYHKKAGGPHAEVSAIKYSKENVKGSELFVTLEPCCFFGKTPPCTELIISSGIKKVTIGSIDPNPRVAGKGIMSLKKNGISVEHGVLKEKTDLLIEEFRKFILTGKPFVTVKAAITLDGKIASRTGDSKWISSEKSRKIAHKLRDQNDAILVGIGTVNNDNPRLDVRLVKGRNPIRVIIDKDFKIRHDSNIFKISGSNLIFVSDKKIRSGKRKFPVKSDTEIIGLKLKKGRFNWDDILRQLSSRNIISILVEGGSGIISDLLKTGNIDRFIFFISPRIFSDDRAIPFSGGLEISKVADGVVLNEIECDFLNPDIYYSGKPVYSKAGSI